MGVLWDLVVVCVYGCGCGEVYLCVLVGVVVVGGVWGCGVGLGEEMGRG